MKNPKPLSGMKKLQRLYDSEINFRLSCFWDGGIDWKLGDKYNGFKEVGSEDTLKKAIDAIWEAARKHYPNAEAFRGIHTGPLSAV